MRDIARSAREFHGPLRRAFLPVLGDAPVTPDLLALCDEALPCPTSSDRDVWDPATGSADRPTLRDQIERARADLGSPWPAPLASTAARVRRDGDRAVHEGLVLARQQRLSRAAVAAAATLDPRLIDEVADGVWQLCEQSSWCWPAHEDLTESGAVLPDVDRPVLDLGAGEVVAQLAWIDHLLGAELDRTYPGLRARVRREARRRVFDPFTGWHDWHWLGLDGDVHNWSPWIHGNVLTAALRLLDGEDEAARRATIVDLSISGLDRYVAALPEDGAVDEGYHYWWNGACRALEALDVLRHATHGRLDALTGVASLSATVGFPHRMHLGGDWVLNLADGSAKLAKKEPWDALHRAARQVGDREAQDFATSHRRPGGAAGNEASGLGRLLRAMTDPCWISAGQGVPPLPREVWLESVQVRVVRERSGTAEGLTLAVKGGHNGEHHNHNDVGEVIVASDGVPVLVDAGRPTYTAATFGPDRYSLWMMQSQWHNVPLVRGVQQSLGHEFRATRVSPVSDGLDLDLAEAYPVPGLAHWRRSARLVYHQAVLHDSWDLAPWTGDEPEPPTLICFLVSGSVQLSKGSARIIPLDGARALRLSWPDTVAGTLTRRPVHDPMLDSVWGPELNRIELDVTGRAELSVVVLQEVTP